MRRTLLAATLLGLWAGSANAIPVTLEVTSGASGGFGFSFLHTATASCQTINGTQFCANGTTYAIANGPSLTGTLDGLHLYDIQGTLVVGAVGGGDDIIVTGGEVNFAASAPDTWGGYLETSTHGTFYFLDHAFAGPANSFDGSTAYLWGNNWNTGTAAGHPNPDWGIDLGLNVQPIPEPGAVGVFSLGLLLSGGLIARSRR